MLIPRGNVLFEKISLAYSDINTLYTNLEQQGFTGYIKIDSGATEDLLFFSHGQFLRAIEHDDGHDRVMTRPRILNRIKSDVPVSVYILPAAMVGVMSLAFAFQPMYRNVEVRKKEFKKIRDQLESDEHSGIVQVNTRDGSHYLIVDRGKTVYDNFAHAYGSILCGLEDVGRFLEYIGKNGAQVNVFAEKGYEIERKRREVEERLERVKVLLARTQSGWFVKDDMVGVDDYIVREWGVRATEPFGVEIELADGTVYSVKCQASKKLGGYVAIPSKLMKRMGLRDSDALSVQPIM